MRCLSLVYSCALTAALLAVVSTPALAYKEGDAVDPVILAKMQIDPAKFTVVDFFAEWCVSCRKELPLISVTHGRVDKQKVDFVGVDTDETAAAAEGFQKELRAKGALSFRTINDTEQALVKQFKPRGYPALYILKEGKVVREHLGAMPNIDAVLAQDLKTLGAH